MVIAPFMPSYKTGQNVTAGAAAAVTLKADDFTVVITNKDASEDAYVLISNSGDATAADMRIPPGNIPICLAKADGVTRLSYFSTGTPDLNIITGNGWLAN